MGDLLIDEGKVWPLCKQWSDDILEENIIQMFDGIDVS